MFHRLQTFAWSRHAALVAALAACGGRSAPPTDVESAPAPLDRAKLDHASLLLRGRDVSPAEWQTWKANDTPVSAIVDLLLDDPFSAEVVAPRLLFKHYYYRKGGYVLAGSYKLREAEGAFYLVKPCSKRRRISVRPWWDLSTTVQVCSDSLRADVWEMTKADGRVMPCSADHASPLYDPSSPCGCGPNLMRCFPAQLAASERFELAMQEEVRATIAHVVQDDLPLAELFVGNATVRSRDVEIIYLKSIAEAKRVPDIAPVLAAVDAWPDHAQLAPRIEIEDGQHAGLITSGHIHFTSGDLRQRMRTIYELLWCAEVTAPGALPEHLLALHTPDLATASDELAARPICTNCHARLDSAMTFFSGYQSMVYHAWHFVPGAWGGRTGTLYAKDIRDRRGIGPLNPHGFAKLAVSQPEFSRCMARDTVEYVFGAATPTDLVDRIVERADPTRITFRQLLRSALLEFVGSDAARVPSIEAPRPITSAGKSPRLADLLDQHCTRCHFGGAPIPDLDGRLDQRTIVKLLGEVMFGRMPPTGALPVPTRLAFVGAAGQELPAGTFTETADYLRAHADPPRALPFFVAREYAHRAQGSAGPLPPINAVENAIDGRETFFTLNYATLTEIEAYRQCSETAGTSSPLACTDRVLERLWNGAAER